MYQRDIKTGLTVERREDKPAICIKWYGDSRRAPYKTLTDKGCDNYWYAIQSPEVYAMCEPILDSFEKKHGIAISIEGRSGGWLVLDTHFDGCKEEIIDAFCQAVLDYAEAFCDICNSHDFVPAYREVQEGYMIK